MSIIEDEVAVCPVVSCCETAADPLDCATTLDDASDAVARHRVARNDGVR